MERKYISSDTESLPRLYSSPYSYVQPSATLSFGIRVSKLYNSDLLRMLTLAILIIREAEIIQWFPKIVSYIISCTTFLSFYFARYKSNGLGLDARTVSVPFFLSRNYTILTHFV